MKSEYYLAIALMGILLFYFGLFKLVVNNPKNEIIRERVVINTGDFIGTKDINTYPPSFKGADVSNNLTKGNSSLTSFVCNRCGKTHTISESGHYIDYIILPCNGEKIMKGY